MTMQFYLEKAVDESSVIAKLSSVLGLALHRIDDPEETGDGVCVFSRYPRGFELGITLAWRDGVRPRVDFVDIAKELSRWTQAPVVTDLPESHPLRQDPFVWCIAEPNGEVLVACEDPSDLNRDGLILDATTRRPLIFHPSGN